MEWLHMTYIALGIQTKPRCPIGCAGICIGMQLPIDLGYRFRIGIGVSAGISRVAVECRPNDDWW
jgi:hypothetical protein